MPVVLRRAIPAKPYDDEAKVHLQPRNHLHEQSLYYSTDAPAFPWRKYLYGKRSDLNLRLSVSVYTKKGTYWDYVEEGKFYQQLRGGGWHELRSASDALND
ncbi:MAG: hypothetical protein JWM04_21 [Verrucomicrobiales bacterium]|jgi:hypothetical protein|nr:hypothetical protein [Verrucomicrobiales bacterium]